MKQLILVPAYGRDYKSAAAAKADWEAGKDFVISYYPGFAVGTYASKAEAGKMRADEFTSIKIRYLKRTRSVTINL